MIQSWGYVGASVSQIDKLYGIRGRDESSKIDLLQTRFDVDSLIRSPFEGFDALRIKLGQSDYRHTELDVGVDPHVRFTNRSLESRVELSHQPIAGWRGRFGVQTDGSTVQALNLEHPDESTVPRTRSNSTAAFIVEETDIGSVRLNAGARIEQVGRRPTGTTNRNFTLGSASFGALWGFTPGYALGSTLSLAQRAPTTEELYSDGAHHPTETYDEGNANLRKETSRNIDLSLQKTEDRLRWKGNLFQNQVSNFVYGRLGNTVCSEDGRPFDNTCDPNEYEELRLRSFSQANATIRGYELDASYNLYEYGWFGRAFTDDSRGTLNNLGYLPLQPVRRVGATIGYQDANWRSSVSILNASSQNRLATSPVYQDEDGTTEKATRGYTRVDANISWRQRIGENELTWFASARNLLNEEIRLSTSLLKDYVPQPGRNFIVGVRARF
jgi:iron complex outermembrane receptor protein